MGTWGCLVSDWSTEGRWQEGGQRQVFPAAVAAETPELSLQTRKKKKKETESERACVYVSKRKSRGQTTSGASSRGSRLRGGGRRKPLETQRQVEMTDRSGGDRIQSTQNRKKQQGPKAGHFMLEIQSRPRHVSLGPGAKG